MIKPTYCKVESKARKFPSFPLDHLLTSASRVSANLCKRNRRQPNQRQRVLSSQVYQMYREYIHFSLLALFVQEDHAYSSPPELLPETGTENLELLSCVFDQSSERFKRCLIIPLVQLFQHVSLVQPYTFELIHLPLLHISLCVMKFAKRPLVQN